MKNAKSTRGQYRHRSSFGKRQEYIAIAELLRHGYDVYMPLVDDQQIDCVIRRDNHDYVDLQIKARSKDCQPKDAGRFAAMEILEPRKKYFFLFYCEQIDTYWIFPSIKLVELASQNKQGKNVGKYDINLTGFKKNKVYAFDKFCQYQNNFEILRADDKVCETKVIFGDNDAADLSAIDSVSISDVDGKVKIVVRHRTSGTVEPSYLNFRARIHFHPHRKMDKALAAGIVAEIENLRKNPKMPIQEVIDLKAWRSGCLGVDLKIATDVQATHALARLCASWCGRNNVPRDKQLEQRTGLDICTIHRIAATDDYKQCIADILFNGSLFKPRTRQEFKAWVEGYGNMQELGNRLRISKSDVLTLLETLASEYGIAPDWMHRTAQRLRWT